MAQAAHWAPAPLFSLTLSVVPHYWHTLKSLDMPAHKTKGTHAQLNISPDLAKVIGAGKGKRVNQGLGGQEVVL